MPKQLHLSVAIELPADEWEEARQKMAVHPAWTEFLGALNAAGVQSEAKVDCCEVRAKRSDSGKAHRTRKPRLVPPPQDAA